MRANPSVRQHDIEFRGLLPAILDVDRTTSLSTTDIFADHFEDVAAAAAGGRTARHHDRSCATRIYGRSLAIAAEPLVARCLK